MTNPPQVRIIKTRFCDPASSGWGITDLLSKPEIPEAGGGTRAAALHKIRCRGPADANVCFRPIADISSETVRPPVTSPTTEHQSGSDDKLDDQQQEAARCGSSSRAAASRQAKHDEQEEEKQESGADNERQKHRRADDAYASNFRAHPERM